MHRNRSAKSGIPRTSKRSKNLLPARLFRQSDNSTVGNARRIRVPRHRHGPWCRCLAPLCGIRASGKNNLASKRSNRGRDDLPAWNAQRLPPRRLVILGRVKRYCQTDRWLAERRQDWAWEQACKEALLILGQLEHPYPRPTAVRRGARVAAATGAHRSRPKGAADARPALARRVASHPGGWGSRSRKPPGAAR